jgi:predicted nucleic acid-binding protein
MIVRSFLDSNVIVYTDDPDEHAKRERAVQLVAAARTTGLGVVSTQVLQE